MEDFCPFRSPPLGEVGRGLTLGVFKDNLGQLRTTFFLCVGGTSLEGGIGRLTDFIKKLSHVVRCCLQLRAGFYPMNVCVPSVVTIAVRMVMTISTMRFNVNLFIFDV